MSCPACELFKRCSDRVYLGTGMDPLNQVEVSWDDDGCTVVHAVP